MCRTGTELLLTADLAEQFAPVFADIRDRSTVAERFIDRNLYSIYVATLWANVVLAPEDVGLLEEDLEDLHDLLHAEIAAALGAATDLKDIYKFVTSKEGERAMAEARLTQSHKDLLTYFASMILDPDGHRRYMDQIRESQKP